MTKIPSAPFKVTILGFPSSILESNKLAVLSIDGTNDPIASRNIAGAPSTSWMKPSIDDIAHQETPSIAATSPTIVAFTILGEPKRSINKVRKLMLNLPVSDVNEQLLGVVEF